LIVKFEEQYEDVLHNLEFGIVRVYQQHSELVDWDAETALNALIIFYNAQARGKSAELRVLPKLQNEVANSVQAMCELHLGRGQLRDKNDQPIEFGVPPKTIEEIIACLKRIRKSVQFWSKEHGRQGYLNFVSNFVL
jgi:hypothetical protein